MAMSNCFGDGRGDSWEDDDFDVSIPVAKPPPVVKSRFEDEEVIRVEKPKAPSPTPMTDEQKRAVQERERKEAERRKREAWVQQELSLQQNETPEQRAQRERRRQEESDAELAADLFGGLGIKAKKPSDYGLPGLGTSISSAVSTGTGGQATTTIKINTPKDMLNLAKQVGPALKEEGNVKAMEFILELLDRATKDTMETDEVVALLTRVTKLRDEKKKAEEALRAAAAASNKEGAKKEAKPTASTTTKNAKDPKKSRADQARDEAADFIGGQFSKGSTSKAAVPTYDMEDDFM